MFRRMILGAILVSTIVILPALGNMEILHAPHLWILLGIGTLASVLQPAYNPFSILLKKGDRGTGAQIIWSIYLVQLAATLEAAYLRYPHSLGFRSLYRAYRLCNWAVYQNLGSSYPGRFFHHAHLD